MCFAFDHMCVAFDHMCVAFEQHAQLGRHAALVLMLGAIRIAKKDNPHPLSLNPLCWAPCKAPITK